jgi:hypothetical protein
LVNKFVVPFLRDLQQKQKFCSKIVLLRADIYI